MRLLLLGDLTQHWACFLSTAMLATNAPPLYHPASIIPLPFSFLPANLACDDGVMVRMTKALRGHMMQRGAWTAQWWGPGVRWQRFEVVQWWRSRVRQSGLRWKTAAVFCSFSFFFFLNMVGIIEKVHVVFGLLEIIELYIILQLFFSYLG